MKLNEFGSLSSLVVAVKPDCLYNMDMLFVLSVKYNILETFWEYKNQIASLNYMFKESVWSAIVDKCNETT